MEILRVPDVSGNPTVDQEEAKRIADKIRKNKKETVQPAEPAAEAREKEKDKNKRDGAKKEIDTYA